MKLNTSTIVCLIIGILLIAIIIRLATNEGKLMEYYRKKDDDPCPRCRDRYSYCKSRNDPNYDCKGWAGEKCGTCGL